MTSTASCGKILGDFLQLLVGRFWVSCYVYISELLIQVVPGEALENGSMNNVILYLREHDGNTV